VSESVSLVCQRILMSLRMPFTEPDVDEVTASIGISLFPDDGDDADTLLKHADIAMYESKRRSRNTISFFTAEMTRKMMRRLELESDLRRAIDNNELDDRQASIAGQGAVLAVGATREWICRR
jgi:predicted signal transduction protein with EAL and GGDEF domain